MIYPQRMVRTCLIFAISFVVTCQIDSIAQWTNRAEGLYGGDIKALAANDNTLFAGTYYGGIFRSTDKGANWSSVKSTEQYVQEIVVANGKVYVAGWLGVTISADNGNTWKITSLNSKGIAGAITIAGNYIYAAVKDVVYRSTDDGVTWEKLTDTQPNTFVSALASTSEFVLVGTNSKGAYRINMADNAITALPGLDHTMVYDFLVRNNVIYAATSFGVYRSTNSGDSWTRVLNPTQAVTSLAQIGSEIFAGCYFKGVYRSVNEGSNWSAVNSGLTNDRVNDIIVVDTDIFIGTTEGGVFRSANSNSIVWQNVSKGITNAVVDAIAVTDTYLFAGTRDGIYRSADYGIKWEPVNEGLTSQYTRNINAFLNVEAGLIAATSGGLFRTLNGTSWQQIAMGITNPNVKAIAMMSNGYLFASVLGQYVYRSLDNGATWEKTKEGLPNNSAQWIGSLGTDLYVGFYYNGIFKSSDYGITWTEVNNGLTDLDTQSFGTDGSNLYVATIHDGIFKSSNKGDTWIPFSAGFSGMFPTNLNFNNRSMFIADFNGFYRLNNVEEPWVNVYNEVGEARSIAVTDDYIFVGSHGEFWVCPLSFIVSVPELIVEKSSFVSPNPSHETAYLNFPSCNGARANFQLINLAGNLMCDGSVVITNGKAEVDLGDMPGGLYVIKGEACGESFVFRLAVE